MDMRCRITSGGRKRRRKPAPKPRESATENKPPPPARTEARVNRCGKSAPRFRQRKRHGKPHREQDRIGTATERKLQPFVRVAVRVGCFRRRATGVAEEWPSRLGCVRSRPYRTRLTGRLIDKGARRKHRRAPANFQAR